MDIWTNLGRYSYIDTSQLLLRPFRFSDSQAFFAIARVSGNLSFDSPSIKTKEESDYLMVHSFMKAPLGNWAIEEKKSQTLIGAIRFEKIDFYNKEVEISYFIHKDFWSQGYATNALKSIVALAINDLRFKRLVIITHLENTASQKVAQKAGFKKVKQYRGSDRYTHQTREYLLFALRKSGYYYE
ncbi:GNAT family N-acetyltransferase [Streptococcus sp. CSL10205-OR2]|uniref:GNAT family N-acetyltransferase n=1 Tax=Streptococcus sp. CSL10205-OR2 TaxID=2980558 RepID=UPI0021D89833|nr:GNAT family N-acetyltransferase [Streptococcus sp. CSL10205-OR2]MCU9533910.1 GNAT family N-acetyltransferase [Streptococcus sp. CSL10205-OR2]